MTTTFGTTWLTTRTGTGEGLPHPSLGLSRCAVSSTKSLCPRELRQVRLAQFGTSTVGMAVFFVAKSENPSSNPFF